MCSISLTLFRSCCSSIHTSGPDILQCFLFNRPAVALCLAGSPSPDGRPSYPPAAHAGLVSGSGRGCLGFPGCWPFLQACLWFPCCLAFPSKTLVCPWSQVGSGLLPGPPAWGGGSCWPHGANCAWGLVLACLWRCLAWPGPPRSLPASLELDLALPRHVQG